MWQMSQLAMDWLAMPNAISWWRMTSDQLIVQASEGPEFEARNTCFVTKIGNIESSPSNLKYGMMSSDSHIPKYYYLLNIDILIGNYLEIVWEPQ